MKANCLKSYVVFTFFLLLFSIGKSNAQTDEETTDSIVTFAEQMPEFPGGQDSINIFLNRIIPWKLMYKHCPDSGRIILVFVVDSTGYVIKPDVLNSCSRSVKRKLAKGLLLMPRWKPALQNHKPVQVKYTLPFTYKQNR